MTRPPRLIARTLAVTFAGVTVILTVIFVILMVEARARVRTAELEKLRLAAQVFGDGEARRQQEEQVVVATLAENPTLKAALDTYFTEQRFSGIDNGNELLRNTVAVEAAKLAKLTGTDILAVVDPRGYVFASAGPLHDRWPPGQAVRFTTDGRSGQDVIVLPRGAFRVSSAVLHLEDREIGTLLLGTTLDVDYARDLSRLSGTHVVITHGDTVLASTLPYSVTADFALATPTLREDTRVLNGEAYAIRLVSESGRARIYTLTSVDAAARAATQSALLQLAGVAGGAFLLAAIGSLWLARTLADPIDRLAADIARMTAARDRLQMVALTGTSRELDALADAFNNLVGGLVSAEEETRAAYLGAIRALAAALDARDPYTAGHSDRVSALSVRVGRQMGLGERDVDVLALGALLHDIGKIGVTDDILRKPGTLTADEFEQLKRHTLLGARILRQVPFLKPHIPIVELHHEQPDGRGYPYGLFGPDIPVAARIVRVADAFDAITTARAYRAARTTDEALIELQLGAGSEFDRACVDALTAVVAARTRVRSEYSRELAGQPA